MKVNKRNVVINGIATSLILLAAITSELFARAGGSGGSSHSSSHSFSSGHSFSGSYSHIGGGGYYGGMGGFGSLGIMGMLVIAFFIVVIYMIVNNYNKKYGGSFYKNQESFPVAAEEVPGYDEFIAANPDFVKADFNKKVEASFYAIQDAWTRQDLSKVRRFISDGVYQRFNTQFIMTGLLKQNNILSNIAIHSVDIAAIRRDCAFDVVDVRIKASMDDEFHCELSRGLDSSGNETFAEYWSFIRKRSVKDKNIFAASACPSCEAPLPADIGEVCQCPHCKALVNSGEFDWVLSEITQQDDYARSQALDKENDLDKMVPQLAMSYEDFSVQMLEDKASNGFLQIMTAFAMHDPLRVKRFATESAFDDLSKRMPISITVFNRIYLNDVTLIGAWKTDGQNVTAVAITYSSQRAEIRDKKSVKLLDSVVVSATQVVILCRNENIGATNKGSLYMHRCPSCGAPVSDTASITCGYCIAALNDAKNEWIISGLLSLQQYESHVRSKRKDAVYTASPQLIDSLYNIRDYALNNIMIIVAADGVFDAQEQTFVENLAKKWNYKLDTIAPLFDMAKSGRLSIRMPVDMNTRRKIFQVMEAAAQADGEVSVEEKKVLDFVEKEFVS